MKAYSKEYVDLAVFAIALEYKELFYSVDRTSKHVHFYVRDNSDIVESTYKLVENSGYSYSPELEKVDENHKFLVDLESLEVKILSEEVCKTREIAKVLQRGLIGCIHALETQANSGLGINYEPDEFVLAEVESLVQDILELDVDWEKCQGYDQDPASWKIKIYPRH